MEITQVRVFPVDEDKLKAFVSIVIDECFVVSDIKIIEGTNGLFISMPSKKRKNGTFRDIAHPLNNETRRRLEERIVEEYRDVVGSNDDDDSTHVRTLGAESAQNGEDGAAEAFEEAGDDAAKRGDSEPAGGLRDLGERPDPPDRKDGRPSWP